MTTRVRAYKRSSNRDLNSEVQAILEPYQLELTGSGLDFTTMIRDIDLDVPNHLLNKVVDALTARGWDVKYD